MSHRCRWTTGSLRPWPGTPLGPLRIPIGPRNWPASSATGGVGSGPFPDRDAEIVPGTARERLCDELFDGLGRPRPQRSTDRQLGIGCEVVESVFGHDDLTCGM